MTGSSLRPTVVFLTASMLVVGLFAGAAALIDCWETWQAESFGDRRLATPTGEECGVARAILADSVGRRAALLRSVGAADQPMEFRAFAWRSSGERIGRGADWRDCPGLGRYVRGLGMARMNSGDMGPRLYISRAEMAGNEATAFETFYPPKRLDGQDVERRLADQIRSWQLRLRSDRAGRWSIVARRAAVTPD